MPIQYVTLAEANEVLRAAFGGNDVKIVLEPDEARIARRNADQEHALWCFDPATGQIERGDKRFFAMGVVLHPQGYYAAAIREEPSVPHPADGSPWIVGQIVVTVNAHGLVKTKVGLGLDGEILELGPSSLSKAELADPAKIVRTGRLLLSNPQRISGFMQPVLVAEEFPNEQGMTPAEFRQRSTDCRSIAALAALDL